MSRNWKERVVLVVLSGVVSPALALGPSYKIEPNDPSLVATGGFGFALAVEGETMVVGSPIESDVVEGAGAAYVFERVGGVWSQAVRLVSSAPGFNRVFGWSVAVSGNVAVIGEPHIDLAGSGIGAAFVFRRVGGVWTEEARLLPADSSVDDNFGIAVAVNGNTLAVGATGRANGFVGRAYVFTWDGSSWSETQTLTASDASPDDDFGTALAFAQNGLFVDTRTAVYIFEQSGGVWGETQRLTASDGTAGDVFGYSIASDGKLVVVGALTAADSGAGAVYVLARNEVSWIEQAKLTPPTPRGSEGVGRSVAICGDNVVAGGKGVFGDAHLFDRLGPGWVYRDLLTDSDFGLVGAVAVDRQYAYAAGHVAVYVYELPVPIPAVSSWCLGMMTVLLLIAGTLFLRKRRVTLAVPVLALLLVSPAFAQMPDLTKPHHPERLIVRYKPSSTGTQRIAVDAAIGAHRVRSFAAVDGLSTVKVAPAGLAMALAAYAAHPDVLYVEPDYTGELLAEPNDPKYVSGSQYGLAAINASAAWDLWTGDPNFRIAIVDTGIYHAIKSFSPYTWYYHEDLADNMWKNPAEFGLLDGVDDDGNGYVDDIHGYDFDQSDMDVFPFDIPAYYHGTHVAGIAGAVSNNAIGMASVNWRCKIVSLQITDSATKPHTSTAIAALQYVIDEGIRVSNHSYRVQPSQAFYDMLEASRNSGHIVVTAAGNDARDIDIPGQQSYPASYALDNIITVTATDSSDALYLYGNFGAVSVDLAAPGVGILSTNWSTNPNQRYNGHSGTSFAAPHVTGVVALVWGRHPGWDYLKVRGAILNTVRATSELAPITVTGGILDAYAAVNYCYDNGDCEDDGLFCTGVECCSGNACVSGGDPCPGQMCNEATDMCVDCLVDLDCGAGLKCCGGLCHECCNNMDCPGFGNDCCPAEGYVCSWTCVQ